MQTCTCSQTHSSIVISTPLWLTAVAFKAWGMLEMNFENSNIPLHFRSSPPYGWRAHSECPLCFSSGRFQNGKVESAIHFVWKDHPGVCLETPRSIPGWTAWGSRVSMALSHFKCNCPVEKWRSGGYDGKHNTIFFPSHTHPNTHPLKSLPVPLTMKHIFWTINWHTFDI